LDDDGADVAADRAAADRAAPDAATDRAPHQDERSPGRTVRWAHVGVVGLVAVLALLGTALIVLSSQPRQEPVGLASTEVAGEAGGDAPDLAPSPDATLDVVTSAPPQTTTRVATQDTVVVHVVGRVGSPGVVELPAGSRVVDALDAAGGVLPDTTLDAVNLARVLVDGEQVRVDLPPDPGVQASAPPSSGSGSAPAAPVDLNVASAAEFDELPGVGPVLAGRIVAWREENGPFTAVDQLLEVAGIGPAVFDDLDDRVRV